MTQHRLTPFKSHGWHRVGGLAAVAFAPLTVMLWTMDAFGGGEIGLTSALIFYAASLVLCVLLAFGMTWAMKGFAIRVKGEDDEDEDRHARRSGPPAAVAGPPAGGKGAHPKAGAHK